MSGKTKKKNAKKPLTEGTDAAMHEAIIDGVRKMLKKHGGEIRQLIGESEQNMASISFPVKIDGSEAETTIKTGIRFASTVSDSVTSRLDDPNQGTWEEILSTPEDDEPKAKKKKAKDEEGGSEGEGENEPV